MTQMALFDIANSFKNPDEEFFTCRSCKQDLPISLYQVRSDRSNYRAKDCLKCTAEESRVVENIRKTAPSKPDKCDCCHKPLEKDQFYLDHCHIDKTFRGWLCNSCNSGIGILGDTEEALQRALDYLRKTNG